MRDKPPKFQIAISPCRDAVEAENTQSPEVQVASEREAI
jgi:hypothetical protein